MTKRPRSDEAEARRLNDALRADVNRLDHAAKQALFLIQTGFGLSETSGFEAAGSGGAGSII